MKELIEKVIRPDVRAMSAYAVQQAEGFVKLDAMENPYTLPDSLKEELAQRLSKVALNRYPVPLYTALKAKICQKMGIPEGFDVLLGNGSDELIAIVTMACATKEKCAKMLVPMPSFVMYAFDAQLAGMDYIGVDLKEDLTLDVDAMLAAIEEHQPSLVFLAMPHNPTGRLFEEADILRILDAMEGKGIVVSDEAYQPFTDFTMLPHIKAYPNLVVMRTVSKLGLAGIRLGYMTAAKELLAEFDKVRPPYNVNVLTEATAELAMDHIDVFNAQAAAIRAERTRLAGELASLPGVEVFPSQANIQLIRVKNADAVFDGLVARRILIKNVSKQHPLLKDCLRITVSTPDENNLFLEAFKACLANS